MAWPTKASVGQALSRIGQLFRRVLLFVVLALLLVFAARLIFTTPAGLKSADWLIKFLQVAAWPAVVLLGLLLAFGTANGSRLLSSLVGRLRKITAFGVELDLTPEAAKEVQPAFDDYRRRINTEFDRQVHTRRVDDLLALVVDQSMKENFKQVPTNFRCTVHVQDVLFASALYQLLDYYPSGNGRGRAFSIRYGIIGRTWRFLEDQIDGDVSTVAQVLLEKWGMTRTEAAAAAQSGTKSFVCIVLRDLSNLPVGILYFDSKTKDAFGSQAQATEFADNARTRSNECGLTKAITDLGQEMRRIGPAIRVFK